MLSQACHCVRIWTGVDQTVEGEMSDVWNVDSVDSKYAGLRRSMETTDSLPLATGICLM